jgi:cell division protein FtsW
MIRVEDEGLRANSSMERIGRATGASTTITCVCAALLLLGVVMVLSASARLDGPSPFDAPLSSPAMRQAAFALMALLTVLLVGLIPYEIWGIRRSAWQPAVLMIVLALLLCAVVLVPGIGIVRNGARRWLPLGPAGWGLVFQPSEVAKVALIIFLAAYCTWRGEGLRRFWSGLMPALCIIGALAALIGKEDFGTTALLVAVSGAILLAGGARLSHLLLCSMPGIVGMVWLILAEPYRVQRLMSFQNIWDDPLGAGYHQVQSLITIAAGGWWGQGLGAGIQKYGYLPEARSDFIFAVICEELGLVGGACVLALYLVLVWKGWTAMRAAGSEFGRLLALGAVTAIGLQAAINVAVVTVTIPTKGIALPMVSAGGSGVILLGFLMGVLVNVARRRTPSLVHPLPS